MPKIRYLIECHQGGGAPSFYEDPDCGVNLPLAVAREVFKQEIGNQIIVYRETFERLGARRLTEEQTCEEFGLDYKTYLEIARLKAQINGLWLSLMKK